MLQVLDGRQVKAPERRAAQLALEQEDAFLALMLRNACMAHKMVGEAGDWLAGCDAVECTHGAQDGGQLGHGAGKHCG
jgi:hypothetical protein